MLSCVFGNAAVIPLYAQEMGTLEQNSVTYVQITDLSTISADEQYVLVGWRYFGGTDPDATKGYVLHSDNNGNLRAVTSDSYASITYAENGGVLPDLALWNLTGSGETFTIRNVSTKRSILVMTFLSPVRKVRSLHLLAEVSMDVPITQSVSMENQSAIPGLPGNSD